MWDLVQTAACALNYYSLQPDCSPCAITELMPKAETILSIFSEKCNKLNEIIRYKFIMEALAQRAATAPPLPALRQV